MAGINTGDACWGVRQENLLPLRSDAREWRVSGLIYLEQPPPGAIDDATTAPVPPYVVPTASCCTGEALLRCQAIVSGVVEVSCLSAALLTLEKISKKIIPS